VLLPIYQRWPLLVLGLVALMGSLAVGPLRTAFEQQPSSLTDAAMAAGSTELGAMRRVALPLAFPAIMASMATIALHTAKELPMTLLLRPSGTDTLATRLWSWAGVSDDASVGPYALALIAIALPPTAVMAYRDRRSARAAVAGEWLAR
jgi:iron(III) transport system permease protein